MSQNKKTLQVLTEELKVQLKRFGNSLRVINYVLPGQFQWYKNLTFFNYSIVCRNAQFNYYNEDNFKQVKSYIEKLIDDKNYPKEEVFIHYPTNNYSFNQILSDLSLIKIYTVDSFVKGLSREEINEYLESSKSFDLQS